MASCSSTIWNSQHVHCVLSCLSDLSRLTIFCLAINYLQVLTSSSHLPLRLSASNLHPPLKHLAKGELLKSIWQFLFFLILSGCTGSIEALPHVLLLYSREPPSPFPQPLHVWEISLGVAKTHGETEHCSLFQAAEHLTCNTWWEVQLGQRWQLSVLSYRTQRGSFFINLQW